MLRTVQSAFDLPKLASKILSINYVKAYQLLLQFLQKCDENNLPI